MVAPLSTPRPTQVELMEKVCKKLRFKYHQNFFANPMLTSFYANLEALVYEEEVVESKDVTVPPYEDQDKKLSEFVDAITEEFGTVTFDIYTFSFISFNHFHCATWLCFDNCRFQQLRQTNERVMLMLEVVRRHQKKTSHKATSSKQFETDG